MLQPRGGAERWPCKHWRQRGCDGSVIDNGPKSDAEWLKVRHAALVLGEAMNLLAMPGRPVAHQFKQQREAADDNNLSFTEVERLIGANRLDYARLSQSMQQAAKRVIVATDQQDAKALAAAGNDINENCEPCHQRFWYPQEGGTG
jgi:hypothetical protein